MAAIRMAFLVTVALGAISAACDGESTNGERDEGPEVGGARAGGTGGATESGTGGTAIGGSAAAESGGASAVGGAGSGTSGGASSTGGAGGSVGGMGGGAGAIASCDDVTPCGGDVVGSWTVVDSCLRVSGVVDLTGFGLGCTSVPTTGSLAVTGTWGALADGGVLDDTTTSGDAQLEFAGECGVTSAQPIRCPALAGPIAPNLGYASLACTDSTNVWCDCSGTFEQTGGMAFISSDPATNGTYATADGVLTVSDGTTATDYSYCSTNDTLTLSLKSVGKTGTVTGTIVLQRQ